MPKTEESPPDGPKPDEQQGVKRADGEFAHAYEQIKSAGEELARLDQLVFGMERGGERPPVRQGGTGAERGGTAVNEAPTSEKTSENKALLPAPGVRQQGRPMLLALVGFLLAGCIFGAALASRYRDEANAIMARWARPVTIAHQEASEPRGPTRSLIVQAADATEQPSPPAAPSQKETKDVPSTGATPSADRTFADQTSADLAQSLKTIAHDLANINEKLDQLKSSHEQTLREHADAIQQLKTAQEQSARDNARMAAQVQALQAQLAALSAKPPAQTAKKENDAAPRQRQSVVAVPRSRRPPTRWRPPSYMDEPWDDAYW